MQEPGRKPEPESDETELELADYFAENVLALCDAAVSNLSPLVSDIFSKWGFELPQEFENLYVENAVNYLQKQIYQIYYIYLLNFQEKYFQNAYLYSSETSETIKFNLTIKRLYRLLYYEIMSFLRFDAVQFFENCVKIHLEIPNNHETYALLFLKTIREIQQYLPDAPSLCKYKKPKMYKKSQPEPFNLDKIISTTVKG